MTQIDNPTPDTALTNEAADGNDNTKPPSTLIQWTKAAATRALKTAAQAALATIPTTAITIGTINWTIVASTAALAAIASLLTSIAGIPEVSGGSSLKQITSN